jgi:hypothetical protein
MEKKAFSGYTKFVSNISESPFFSLQHVFCVGAFELSNLGEIVLV